MVPLINREAIPRYTKFRLKDEADAHVIVCDNCSGPRFHGELMHARSSSRDLCCDCNMQVPLKFVEARTKTSGTRIGHLTFNSAKNRLYNWDLLRWT
jgi:hypothetical protein